jgi:hypothetical protein
MEETNEEEGAPGFNEGDRCEISDMKVADLVLVRPAGMDGIDTADDIQYPIDQDGYTKRCDGHQEAPEYAEEDGARGSAECMDQDLVTVEGEACLLDQPEEVGKATCYGSVVDRILGGIECVVTGPVRYCTRDGHHDWNIGQWARATDEESPNADKSDKEPNATQDGPAQLEVCGHGKMRIRLGVLGIHLDWPSPSGASAAWG